MADEMPFTIDELAQEIRRVDGKHDKGAGALAEALMPFLSDRASREAALVEVKPLEWRSEPPYSVARPLPGMHYAIEVYWGEDESRPELITLRGSTGTVRSFDTVDEAKVAAQSNFDRAIRAALAQHSPAPEADAPRCFDCSELYSSDRFADLVIDHESFAEIAITPPDGGLLCPNCMCSRLAAKGIVPKWAKFTSGPLAGVPQAETEADAIAKAREEERERCAKIADHAYRAAGECCSMDDSPEFRGEAYAAKYIAAAIRAAPDGEPAVREGGERD